MHENRRDWRLPGVDVFRGLSVVLMMLAHGARVVPERHPAPSASLHELILGVEPTISACFMFLVGWSLSASWRQASELDAENASFWTWYRRVLSRAATLYAAGILLFALQYGVEFPDIVFSPDILSSIAWALVLLAPLVAHGGLGVPLFGVVTLAGAALMERLDSSVSGVNAGPGGVVPLIAFAAVGAGWFQAQFARPSRDLWLLAVAGVVSLSALLLPGRWVVQQPSLYLDPSERPVTVWFWNHSLKGTLVIVGPVLLGALVFTRPARPWKMAWAHPARLLGRHALVVYVGHLLVLGLLTRSVALPPGEMMLCALVAALTLLFLGVVMLLESEPGQRVRDFSSRRLGVRL